MIRSVVTIILAIAIAFGLGSIPTGYWYGRLRGVDIRSMGSGNIGATNVQRIFGTWAGLGVLLVDVAKGFLAAYMVSGITPYPASDFIRVACGIAAIGGHTFTPWLNFKGGKGVATTYGVFLGLAPVSTVLVFLAFLLVVAMTRYVSAGSLVSAVLFPILIWLTGESGLYFSILLLSIVISVIIGVRHRANAVRIWQGTENRLGERVSPPQEGSKP